MGTDSNARPSAAKPLSPKRSTSQPRADGDPQVDLESVQGRLGVRFHDAGGLRTAFVHESYLQQAPHEQSYQRLEFLGDAVVDLAVREMLCERFPDLPEGALTRMKAMLVSGVSLAAQARELELGGDLLLSAGSQAAGDRDRASLLADVFEAVIGAYFLDSGWDAARALLRRRFQGSLDALPTTDRNYKSLLQELTSRHFKALPAYQVTREKGPPHSRVFTVEASFRDEVLGRGVGRSKKEAAQEAAREALGRLSARLAEETDASAGEQGSARACDAPQGEA